MKYIRAGRKEQEKLELAQRLIDKEKQINELVEFMSIRRAVEAQFYNVQRPFLESKTMEQQMKVTKEVILPVHGSDHPDIIRTAEEVTPVADAKKAEATEEAKGTKEKEKEKKEKEDKEKKEREELTAASDAEEEKKNSRGFRSTFGKS